jgi:hypothetical protein
MVGQVRRDARRVGIISFERDLEMVKMSKGNDLRAVTPFSAESEVVEWLSKELGKIPVL